MPESDPRSCSRCGTHLASVAVGSACASCMLEASFDFGDEEPLADEPAGRRERIAGYELEEEIAHGGMGVVWRGRQIALGRTVALKLLLHGRYASPETVERFRREAQSAAALRHPHIVAVHEVGECDGQHFIAMEFVAGQTLAQLLRTGPLPPRRAAEIALAIAEAVAHAHERGVLHRDLKPSNILLDAEGLARLTDFGLAKPMDGSSDLTLSGQMVGTPAYLSPEVAAGSEGGASSDGYAIGAVLYEMLTGRPPFLAVSLPETLRRIREDEPVSPRLLNRSVPRDLETIALKCLSKTPARRFAAVAELAAELRRFLAGEPIRTRPIGPLERLAKWARRRKQLAALLLVTLLALLGGIAVLSVANVRILAAQAQTVREAEEKRLQLVRLNVANGNRLAESGDAFAALLRYAEALRLDADDEKAAQMHRLRFAAAARGAPRLAGLWLNGGDLVAATLSPDETRVAVVEAAGHLRVHGLAAGSTTSSFTRPGGWQHAWFTPGSDRLIAVAPEGSLHFLGLGQEQAAGPVVPALRAESAPPSFIVDAYARSADSRSFTAPVEGGVQVFDTATGRPLWPEPAAVRGFAKATFSADGRRVLLAGEAPTAQVRETSSGATIWTAPADLGRAVAAALNGDGTRALVVAGIRGSELTQWHLPDGRREWTHLETGRTIFSVSFSPDGQHVALASQGSVGRLLDATTGTRLTDALNHRGIVWECLFHPDGQSVATFSVDQTARLWDVATGRPRTPWLRHADMLYSGAFTRDGRHLLTQGKDPVLRLWNLEDRATSLVLRPGGRVLRALFTPNARRIVTAGQTVLRSYDAASGLLQREWMLPANATDAACAADNERVAAVCEDGSLVLVSLTGSEEAQRVAAHRGRIQRVEFHPDGQSLLTAGLDHTVRLWRTSDGHPLAEPLWHGAQVRDAYFRPDGRVLASSSDDATVQRWETSTGARIGPPLVHPAPVFALGWSPDGKRLLAGCWDQGIRSRSAQVWDAETGQPLGAPLEHLDGIYAAVFDPTGRIIATAGEDSVAALWSATTYRRLTPALRHDAHVQGVRFSPDGRLVATWSSDATTRVWECATGEQVTPPLRHGGFVESVVWHPDGKSLLTASRDGTARVWNLSPATDSVEALTALAELLAALRLDPVAGQVPLSAAEIEARWQAVGRSLPR